MIEEIVKAKRELARLKPTVKQILYIDRPKEYAALLEKLTPTFSHVVEYEIYIIANVRILNLSTEYLTVGAFNKPGIWLVMSDGTIEEG